jgi:peptidoglycan/LPS O-acetylase OafA/YrhL
MATDKSVFTKIGNFNYLRCFGVCSYGAFLFHFPIYMLLQSYNPLLRPTLGLPLAIAAGYLSYTFVEAPSMRRASQRAKLLLLRQSPIPDPIREK